jgi:peptidyl-dipeptidase A
MLACGDNLQREVDAYLTEYAETMQALAYESDKAEWASNTRIVEGDTTNAARTKRANEALAAYVGSVENIERIRGYLDQRDRLTALQVRQLEAMLFEAADKPGTVPELVAQRIAAETEQVEQLYGYEFTLDGQPLTANEIDALLRESTDLARRRAVWEASKQVGPTLKSGLVNLQQLRNQTVQALGYSDFFSYQVSEYDMTTEEMLEMTEKLVEQLEPLYREIHTWVRHELADRYGVPVPDLLPAHWLPNRWSQDWTALVSVEGLDVGAALGEKSAEWIVRQGEEFYKSLGFAPLPESFYQESSLYPLPPDATYKKNSHASAWHLDLAADVRSLMSVEPDPYWWETTLHELGHIYYYMSYSRPEVPIVLRGGANRAYHEGVGSLIGLASMQRQFLVGRGLVPADAQVDQVAQLLFEAMNYVRWWELVERYQGVAPPEPRGEEYADAVTKTHINNDAAQYYDYALSYALLFQLHDHIARNILVQDPHDTDYWGSQEVGAFLKSVMAPGASRPWREVLRETTGRELDAQAMVDYFQPLYEWLVVQNQGREHTLPELD